MRPRSSRLISCSACASSVELDRLGFDAHRRSELQAEVESLRRIFQQVGLDHTRFRRRLRALVARPGPAPAGEEVMHRSQASRRAFERAERIAAEASPGEEVGPQHLLQALLELPEPPWAGLLAEMGLHNALGPQLGGAPTADRGQAEAGPGEGAEAVPQKARPRRTPTLDRFGRDLTQLARGGKLDPVIGRREEMRSLARVLSQKRKNNAILVGEAGVGKTCIVEGLAQRLSGPHAPPNLRDRRLVEVSMAGLVAGTKYRGEFEERLQGLVKEASSDANIILFIDEIHTLLGAGGEGPSDAANILKPALARSEIRCIGATTIAEYRRYIEKDPALERRFQLVWVDEPTREEAVQILRGLRPKLEQHHGLEVTDAAIEAAVELSLRYLPDLRLPDKAIDLLDQACASARIASLSTRSDLPATTSIGRPEIAAVVAERCRLPVERVGQEEAQRLLAMEATLRQRVMGQDEAIRVVAEAIRAARAGLKNPRKPVGTFLFVGATGTGKTELAKALAEFLFDDERRLISINLSEYTEKHTVARLIGAPPGYVGYEEEGQLTGPVRTYPYSVVLFDELEKAHPEVLDILLQVLDEGRLTDSKGRRASFTETVIILTSNLGSGAEVAARPIGLELSGAADKSAAGAREAYQRRIMDALQRSLRPELLNRIERIVFFYPLGEAAVRRIIDKILVDVGGLLRERRIQVELTDAAYALLMKEGFSPRFGAREMERAVKHLLVEPLGKALLEGRVSDGATVRVDACDDRLQLEDVGRTQPAGLDR